MSPAGDRPAGGLGALLAPPAGRAYLLLLLLLAFNSLRPDRLLPGGMILAHFPTLVIALLGFMWLAAGEKKLGNRQTLLFSLFLVVVGVGTLFARNQRVAFELGKSLFLYAYLPYLYFVQFVRTPAHLTRYLRIATVLGAFFAVLGITHKAQLAIPMLADENDFCLLMNMFIPLAYFFGRAAEGTWRKLLWYGLALLFIAGNVAAVSRGGMLGLAAVIGYIFTRSRRKVALLAVLGALSLVGLLLVPDFYIDELRSIAVEGGSTGTGKERLESWKAGGRMFMDHPVVGVGPMNFGRWFADYYVSYGLKSSDNMWGRVAHSLYVTVLSETGVLGTGLVVLMLLAHRSATGSAGRLEQCLAVAARGGLHPPADLAVAEEQVRTLRHVALGLNGAMIGFLVTGIFITVLWYSYLWTLLAYGAALENATSALAGALGARPGREAGEQLDRSAWTDGMGSVS